MDLTLGVDTLCVVSVADAYHGELPFGSPWMPLDVEDRKKPLLRLSSRLISQGIEWEGWPTVDGQPFALPRIGLTHPNGGALSSTVVPLIAQHMTAELALQLNVKNRTRDLTLADLDIRAAAGTLFGGGARRKVFPDVVADMLPPGWGVIRGRGGSYVVGVERA